MRLIDLNDDAHVFCGNDGEYQKWNIDPSVTVDAVPVEWIENYLRNYRYMAPIEKNFVREMIKAWEERKEV